MKKNIMRIISLALVAVMVFAFASCKQEILVRFVDADGNDLFQAGSVNVGTDVTPAPDSSGDSTLVEQPTEAPVEQPTEAPVNGEQPTEAPTQAPSNDQPVTEAPTQAPSNDQPATEAPTQAPTQAPTSNAPSSKQDIVNFYAKAANDLKNNGSAAYIKKEWQVVDDINIGNGLINGTVKTVLGAFMTSESKADEQVCAKGSDEAKNRSFAWTLTDLSKVKSATCEVLSNGNYKITIIMADEDTPKKNGSTLGQVTGALLYWEDIDKTLSEDATVTKVLSEYSDIHVVYRGFKIVAEMTKDGKFVSMEHDADVDIQLGHIKLLGKDLDNKSGHMNNYCKFYNFQY